MRLLQLLIVIFIVLIVGSVLIVAVGKICETDHRAQCMNNLKQIGLAAQNYRDTFRYFPPASRVNANLPVEKRLSWLYLIVPFVEADNLYRQFDQDQAWDSEKNRLLPLTVRYFISQCPSFSNSGPTSKFFPTHYLGITGLGTNAALLTLDDPNAG